VCFVLWACIYGVVPDGYVWKVIVEFIASGYRYMYRIQMRNPEGNGLDGSDVEI